MKQLEEDKENLDKQVNCDEHDSDEKMTMVPRMFVWPCHKGLLQQPFPGLWPQTDNYYDSSNDNDTKNVDELYWKDHKVLIQQPQFSVDNYYDYYDSSYDNVAENSSLYSIQQSFVCQVSDLKLTIQMVEKRKKERQV